MEKAIEKVLDLKKWEALQDAIAKTTKLALILVDYKGKPLTHHSLCQPFCQLVRKHPELSAYCEKCDARGGLESVRSEKPYIYRCYFNIVDLAIPIFCNQHYMGAIMAGQIRLTDEHDKLEQIFTVPDSNIQKEFLNTYEDLYQNIPIISMEELKNVADLLFQLSTYIVSEALKNAELHGNRLEPRPLVQVEPIEEPNPSFYQAKNPIIQPAIDEIFKQKSHNFSLDELADLCNLSPSYVSRLFAKEFGQPLSKIYGQWKINWAKDLLDNTQLSITEISDQLGFVESSYFVRVFKKHTGLTPLKYRK